MISSIRVGDTIWAPDFSIVKGYPYSYFGTSNANYGNQFTVENITPNDFEVSTLGGEKLNFVYETKTSLVDGKIITEKFLPNGFVRYRVQLSTKQTEVFAKQMDEVIFEDIKKNKEV